MSGPAESSDGRAVKANHDPSAENAADSPTTLTSDTIATVRATVGSGVTVGVGIGEGVTRGVGLGVALAGGVGVVVADADAPDDGDPVTVGVPVGVGVGVGTAVGSAVGIGVAVGSAVGNAMTSTESAPCASVPTTTAWLRTGDCEIDFGRTSMCTVFDRLSVTGAQSGCRSAGQTWLTGVTL